MFLDACCRLKLTSWLRKWGEADAEDLFLWEGFHTGALKSPFVFYRNPERLIKHLILLDADLNYDMPSNSHVDCAIKNYNIYSATLAENTSFFNLRTECLEKCTPEQRDEIEKITRKLGISVSQAYTALNQMKKDYEQILAELERYEEEERLNKILEALDMDRRAQAMSRKQESIVLNDAKIRLPAPQKRQTVTTYICRKCGTPVQSSAGLPNIWGCPAGGTHSWTATGSFQS